MDETVCGLTAFDISILNNARNPDGNRNDLAERSTLLRLREFCHKDAEQVELVGKARRPGENINQGQESILTKCFRMFPAEDPLHNVRVTGGAEAIP